MDIIPHNIELELQDKKIDINGKNYSEVMQTIDNIIEPGTPVLLQNFSWSGMGSGIPGKITKKILFLSGGHLSSQGVFNLEKGKKHHIYININININSNNQEDYRIVKCHNHGSLDQHKLKIPHSWTRDQHNEGTFSPAPPQNWKSSHKAGTEKLIIGDQLIEQYSDALFSLMFSRDAIKFNLNPFYGQPFYLVTEKDINQNGEEKRKDIATRGVNLTACMNLIKKANKEINDYWDAITASQIGYFNEGVKRFREQKFPVDEKDYLIKELSHPRRTLGFIKINQGVIRGENYILPLNEKMEELTELAFSDEFVKKFYPYGFKD